MLTAVSAIALLGIGCGGRSIEGETPAKSLEVSYVSGHLGSDQGCSASRAAGDAAGAFAPCEPSDTNCGPPPSYCEDGAVTIQLSNVGDAAFKQLDVGALVLRAVGGDDSNLEILGVTRDDGSKFDGTLEPTQAIKIRVKFPAPAYSKVPKGATLQITVVTDGGGEKQVETPELHVMPMWAT